MRARACEAESCGRMGEEGLDVKDTGRLTEAEVQVKHPGTRQCVGELIVPVGCEVAVCAGRNRSGEIVLGCWCFYVP